MSKISIPNLKDIEIVLDLVKEILSLPENPNIQRTGEKSFMVNIKDILGSPGVVIAPSYHIFAVQYGEIARQLLNGINDIGSSFDRVYLRVKAGRFKDMRLHPDVIKRVVHLFNDARGKLSCYQ